jgi:hypothetical protein
MKLVNDQVEESLPVEVLTGTKGNQSIRVGQGGKDTDPANIESVNILALKGLLPLVALSSSA